MVEERGVMELKRVFAVSLQCVLEFQSAGMEANVEGGGIEGNQR